VLYTKDFMIIKKGQILVLFTEVYNYRSFIQAYFFDFFFKTFLNYHTKNKGIMKERFVYIFRLELLISSV